MTLKTKYLILTLFILGVFLLMFNNFKMQLWHSVTVSMMELDVAKILFAIGILSLILFYFSKKWKKGITKIIIGAFTISVLLNIHLTVEHFKAVERNQKLSEYFELKTCEEMEKRFATDLKKGKIKYFQFGIGPDVELQKTLKTKYGIESYTMGCLGQSEIDCYNNLVNEYLKENYNDHIVDHK